MIQVSHTKGEILFEQYFTSQGLPFDFEKEHPGKSTRPDYTVEWNNEMVLFDVKDFDPPEKFPTSFGYFDPYGRLREKIEQGRAKFKQFKNLCCSLVLCNQGNPFVTLQDPNIMLGAMYGDSGFTFPVDTSTGIGDASKVERAFLGKGKMIRPNSSKPQNTTISALITLTKIQPHYLCLLDLVRENPPRDNAQYDAEIRKRIPGYDPTLEVSRVIVWHNAVARIPFPKGLFCGPYDTHFGIAHVEEGVVEQGVTYQGGALPDRLKL